MRTILALIAATAILASCEAPDHAPGNGSNELGNAPAADPPRQSKAVSGPSDPEPARGDTIPASFHGVYDESAEACARPSEYRLTVSPDALRFHESIGRVSGVTIDSPAAIHVAADYQGEGESWRNVRRLQLAGDGSTLTITGEGVTMVRVRCASPGE